MTGSATHLRRRGVAVTVLLVLVALVAALLGGGSRTTSATAADDPPGTAVLPDLAVADADVTLFGTSRRADGAIETWGYRRLPVELPEPIVDGERVPFGPTEATDPEPQLVLLRHLDATGWQVVGTPRNLAGDPVRGLTPNFRAARMAASGAAVLGGQDSTKPSDEQASLLLRKAGGEFTELASPPASVLFAADAPAAGDPSERLIGDRGAGRANVAIVDRSDGMDPLVLAAPVGRELEAAVVSYDGADWTREAVELPASTTSFRIAAIAASAPFDAWLVGSSPGAPVQLFRRTQVAPGDVRWQPVALPSGAWTDADEADAAGLAELTPLAGTAQTLTAVPGGRVWLDLTARDAEGAEQATLLVDPQRPEVDRVTSWCDVATANCDHRFGAVFSTTDGYRSYAWDGEGHGTRVITNPLRPGGEGTSNRGSWLRLLGDEFERRAGGGGNFRPSGAFSGPDRGWLEGPVEVGAAAAPSRFASWPVALRAPLLSVVPAPGASPSDPAAGALAVGADGAVLRRDPQQGWLREFLLSASGAVVRQTLRGVAWPEASRAHAVGDLGAMWQWRSDTGLWERDPAAPVGVEANFTGLAFDPADGQRGYAVGKEGTLLAYGKTWEQVALPAGFEAADFTAITFAGRQAIAASDRGVLVAEPGQAFAPEPGLTALLDGLAASPPRIVAVAGLADGGAVAGGRGVVALRDGPSTPWRFSAQPLLGLTVSAAAAVRDGERVRAVVATVPVTEYPSPDPLVEVDPDVPTPVLPATPLAGDGYLLRETASGWRDEQRDAFAGSGDDRPVKADPVMALALGADGRGWAVGGWTGQADSAGRGVSGSGGSARSVRARVQTAAVLRYAVQGEPDAANATAPPEAAIPLDPGPVRLAIGGHPQCATSCAELGSQAIAPDRMVRQALTLAGELAARPGGPRAFLSTGGRSRPGAEGVGVADERRRFAELLRPRIGLPVFNATSEGDLAAGGDSTAYRRAFSGASQPQGEEASLTVRTDGIPGAAPAPAAGARTHFAFDSTGAEGTVRVVVIDNSAGSLASSDPHQSPAEPQEPWLIDVLNDAKADGVPAIVVGSRDLNSGARPALNVAEDADRIAQLLVDHGASAYFHDRPEENRSGQIPSGGGITIPSFGTGTLGYRSPVSDAGSLGLPDALFGDGGILLAEVDVVKRDPVTNRAPVAVRLIPVIDSLALNAVDGTLLRRSRPSLLQGLGRRPVAGDRWGPTTAGGVPSPTGADPYTTFPSEPCLIAGCSSRIAPEYRFSSSAPDVLDFVAVDPASPNPRKPLLGADDKVISDSVSGLVCPFNAGTATVTVTAGGKAISQQITVLPGSVLRPCGTRPLDPSRIRTQTAAPGGAATPPPPASAPPAVLPALVPPPPPAAPEPDEPDRKITPPAEVAVPLFGGFTAAAIKAGGANSVSPPPPAPGFFAQPIPPGGATVRVNEEKRETEVATEQSQAYAAITADDRLPVEPFIAGLALIAALAGTTIRPGRHRRPAYVRVRTNTHTRPPRRRHLP